MESLVEEQEPTSEELNEQEGEEHQHKCNECNLPFFCNNGCTTERYPEVCPLCELLEDNQ